MSGFTQSNNRSLLTHGVVMIAIGTIVCGLGSMMAKPADQMAGYVCASALIGVYLLSAAFHPALRRLPPLPRRITRSYIATGFALIAYVAFSAIQLGSIDLRIVALLTGLLGLFWAARYLMLAFRFQPRSVQALGLTAVAAANSLLSVLLATRPDPSRLSVVSVCGGFVIVLGVQIYLTSVLLYRGLMREAMPEIP